MKVLVKVFSTAVLLFSLLSFMPFPSLADTNLDHSGKLQIKVDRIGQDDAERQQQGSQDHNDTGLEQIVSDLFKEQTLNVIRTKQTQDQAEMKELKQKLFLMPDPNHSDTALKDMKKVLFTGNYKVQDTVASNNNTNDQTRADTISNKMFSVLGAVALAICGGFYVILRKWMG